ncbi:DUF3846 domain-containing protein [Neorhizobium galegae]|uniref:Polysaccharide inhibition protein n=1 Tax=Neorhizobium galegae bv. orientalis str. HAMBI 540 TaxID=1028800 RepID=A0A068T0N6_NEOGA|nr:hypothetical protein [Neorhizobium galegae]MCQ1855770.1 hypothetical protein [Neorhizobium galegae]CDN51659.1 Polysaccharide inhibition protein [Neorhizobium galegae bv. orientalis str. HAMBI 540]CDZ55508.1 Hypothetical protein NGAL_HAMBI2427_62550 [Neorhizobium galegae bv. orientalis]
MEIDRKDVLKSIYAHIGCTCIDAVRIGDYHVADCDDNGLVDGLECFTQLADSPSPLAGNLLVTGVNEEGDSVSPTHSIDLVAGQFLISRAVFDRAFEHIDEPGIIGTRVAGFTIRVQRSRPTIIRPEV